MSSQNEKSFNLDELVEIPRFRMQSPPPDSAVLAFSLQLGQRMTPGRGARRERKGSRSRPLASQDNVIEHYEPNILLASDGWVTRGTAWLKYVAQSSKG